MSSHGKALLIQWGHVQRTGHGGDASRTFMWRVPVYGVVGKQTCGSGAKKILKTLNTIFSLAHSKTRGDFGWLGKLIFSFMPPGMIGVSFVVSLARVTWLACWGTWDRGGGSTGSPYLADFKRGRWWGCRRLPLEGEEHHLTSSCQRGAGLLELLRQ